jgi:hypothetical protein
MSFLRFGKCYAVDAPGAPRNIGDKLKLYVLAYHRDGQAAVLEAVDDRARVIGFGAIARNTNYNFQYLGCGKG